MNYTTVRHGPFLSCGAIPLLTPVVKDKKLERSQFTIRLYCTRRKQNPVHSQTLGLYSQASSFQSIHEAITQSNFSLPTANTASWLGLLLALPLSPISRYHPADQTAVTRIVNAN